MRELILRLADPEGFLAKLPADERQRIERAPHTRLPELRIPASAAGNKLLPLRDFILTQLREGLS